jgi:DNA-directed RNA polymerase subunit RPC12/RpoP
MPALGTTSGPLHAVPCAHCGTAQDMRILDEQKLIETGQGVVCDHCKRTSRIVGVRETKVIVLRQL